MSMSMMNGNNECTHDGELVLEPPWLVSYIDILFVKKPSFPPPPPLCSAVPAILYASYAILSSIDVYFSYSPPPSPPQTHTVYFSAPSPCYMFHYFFILLTTPFFFFFFLTAFLFGLTLG